MVEKDIRNFLSFLFRVVNMHTPLNKVMMFLFSYSKDLFSVMDSLNIYCYLVHDWVEFAWKLLHIQNKYNCSHKTKETTVTF